MNGNPVKWAPENPNAKIDVEVVGSDPQNDPGFIWLERCQGDCDIDDHCKPGLFCYQVNKAVPAYPGCNNPDGEKFFSSSC